MLTASQPFTSALVMSNLKMFKYPLYWVKPQGTDPLMARFRPMNNVDDIVVFYNNKVIYNPQFLDGKPYVRTRDKNNRINETTHLKTFKQTTTVNNGKRYPIRTLLFNHEKGLHPTQKPVALFEYLIRTYTNEGDLVLDNCAGSFTTAIAAENTKRNFICMEQLEEYCEIGKNRIEENRIRLGMLDNCGIIK